MKRRHKLIVAAAALTCLPSLSSVYAGSTWTFNGSGNWSFASNWLGGVPGNGADAHIVHSDLFSRTITYDYTGSAVTLGTLEVSNGGISRIPEVDTLSQSANTLTANFEYIGTTGNGAYNQSGGTNSFNRSLQLGESESSNGSYSLSGGTLNGVGMGTSSLVAVLDVGAQGAGTFNQTGGTVTLTSKSQLILGDGTTATGTYLLSGNGVLNVFGEEDIGYNGQGNFIQTGGMHNFVGNEQSLRVGSGLGSGTYSLGNGTISSNAVLSANDEQIGCYGLGAGTFIQTGGTNIAGVIFLGLDGSGTYILGNGAAASSAVLNSLGEAIGEYGDGTFIQTGGTHTIAGGLILGYQTSPSSNGTYSLSGGILNISGDERIGYEGYGAFIQSGGTHTLGLATLSANMYLGYASYSSVGGYYALSGTGQANVHGNVYIGGTNLSENDGAVASLTIGGSGTASGGSMTITGLLKIWDSSLPGTHAVNLGTGGFLSIGSLDTSGNPSNFLWSAGTLQTLFDLDLSTLGPLGSSLALSAGKTFIPAGGLSIQPDGVLNLSNGAMIIPSASTASNHGIFNQTGGSLTINGAFVNSATANFGAAQTWGPASVFLNLAGVSTFNSALGPTGPIVVVTGGSVNFNAPMFLQSLTLNDAPASFNGGGIATVKSLAIYGNGKLDLGGNDMIIDYSGPVGSLVNDVRQYLQSGQLTSSIADSTYRLGYADNALLGLTSFGGQSVDSTSLLVKYTYAGDANLDGKVDIADLKLLASHWNQSSQFWTGGDFNYDGVVNVADLVLLAKDWQDGVGHPLAGPDLAPLLASLGLPDLAVPEPTGWVIVSAALAGMIPRRIRPMARD